MSKRQTNHSESIPPEAPKEHTLLDLAKPRTIVLKSEGKHYVWHFRRLTLEDWEKYFLGIVHETLNTPVGREEIFEMETAQLDLVDRTVVAVDGYGATEDSKNWKLALPLHHRLAAGTVLRAVGLDREKKLEPQLTDLIEIRVDATWTAENDEKMTAFRGLVHRFRQPTIAEMKQFNFENARVRVRGTQENGITTYPARQLSAMRMYDELIESVEGYSVHGTPLTDIATIRSEMDGAHKAEAALALFLPDAPVEISQ